MRFKSKSPFIGLFLVFGFMGFILSGSPAFATVYSLADLENYQRVRLFLRLYSKAQFYEDQSKDPSTDRYYSLKHEWAVKYLDRKLTLAPEDIIHGRILKLAIPRKGQDLGAGTDNLDISGYNLYNLGRGDAIVEQYLADIESGAVHGGEDVIVECPPSEDQFYWAGFCSIS